MLIGVLITLGILGAVAVLVALFLQRGREGLDLSLRGLLRGYLYLASLAGVVVFTIGISGILAFALAAAFGRDVIYGGAPPQPVPLVAPGCPPNQPNCTPAPQFTPPPRPDERERRQQDDLVRGVTFIVFGVIFWSAHWAARRGIVGDAERASVMYRAYLMLGTAIFGITTIVLLPTGVYQALSEALVTAPGVYRQGAGESLSGGLGALPLWLAYLWLVQRALRAPAAAPAA